MKPITVFTSGLGPELLNYFQASGLVEGILCLGGGRADEVAPDQHGGNIQEGLTSGRALKAACAETASPYILVAQNGPIKPGYRCLERLLETAGATGAGLVYSDFLLEDKNDKHGPARHGLIDYQPGSVREGFDFGRMILLDTAAVKTALESGGPLRDTGYAGFYDLRLRLSERNNLFHLREPLYAVSGCDSGIDLFAYVDPRNRRAQVEMEAVFTDHLRRIGAYLEPVSATPPDDGVDFPVEASVIIPVRNRAATIGDAIRSALAQQTDFPFNILVVDNHSTDGTTEAVSRLSGNTRVKHIIPSRRDLGIGGCWNEALFSPECGRYAVQLDSDDIYIDGNTLQRIIDAFRAGGYAMVIGSYKLVNPALEEIPPGIIDHSEWTDDNGHNNALRVNGLGAPRAFRTSVIRKFCFPNVSYGEDYAVCLRICREFRIGRIFDPLYLCRRWEGNSDSGLSFADAGRNDLYKDSVRTIEIQARIKLNRDRGAR